MSYKTMHSSWMLSASVVAVVFCEKINFHNFQATVFYMTIYLTNKILLVIALSHRISGIISAGFGKLAEHAVTNSCTGLTRPPIECPWVKIVAVAAPDVPLVPSPGRWCPQIHFRCLRISLKNSLKHALGLLEIFTRTGAQFIEALVFSEWCHCQKFHSEGAAEIPGHLPASLKLLTVFILAPKIRHAALLCQFLTFKNFVSTLKRYGKKWILSPPPIKNQIHFPHPVFPLFLFFYLSFKFHCFSMYFKIHDQTSRLVSSHQKIKYNDDNKVIPSITSLRRDPWQPQIRLFLPIP
jgi:hypothetical protein